MATYPTVAIPVQFMLGASQQQLQTLARNINGLNQQINTLQRGAGGMGQTVTRGIGGFWILHRVMGASFGVIRQGIKDTSELELVLKRLQISVLGNATSMSILQRRAEGIAAALGPLSTTDVLVNMEALSHVVDMTMQNMSRLAGPFSTVVNNLTVLSKGQLSPGAAAGMLQTGLNIFGGARDPAQSEKVLNAIFKGVTAFAPTDPQRLMTVLRPLATTMTGQGYSPEVIVALASLGLVNPSSGRTSGRDISAFFNQMTTLRQRMARGRGRSGAQLRSSAGALGLLDASGEPILSAGAGGPEVFRMLGSMSSAITAMQQRDPKNFAGNLRMALKDVVSQDLAVRFANILGLRPGALGQMVERMAKLADADATAKEIDKTTWASLGRLSSNMTMVLTRIFAQPNRALGFGANLGATRLESLSGMLARNSRMANVMGWGSAALAGGTGMWSLGRLMGAMGMGGRALTGVGGGLAIGGILAGIIAGGFYAFEKSDHFKHLQKQIIAMMERLFSPFASISWQSFGRLGMLGKGVWEGTKRVGTWLNDVTTPVGMKTAIDKMREDERKRLAASPTWTWKSTVAEDIKRMKRLMSVTEKEGGPYGELKETMGGTSSAAPTVSGPVAMRGARAHVVNRKVMEAIMSQAMQKMLHENYSMPLSGGAGLRNTIPSAPGTSVGY